MNFAKEIQEDQFDQNVKLGDAVNFLQRNTIENGNILSIQENQKLLSEKKIVSANKCIQYVQTQIKRIQNVEGRIQILNDFNKNNTSINNNNTYLDLISEIFNMQGASKYYKQPIADKNEIKIVYCIQGITQQQQLNSGALLTNKNSFQISEKYLNSLKKQEATHIITQVNYGFRIFITFSKKNILPNEQRELERKIKEQLKKDYFKINLQNGQDFSISNEGNTHLLGKDIEIEIFSDLPVEFSQNQVFSINNRNHRQQQFPISVQLTSIEQFGGDSQKKIKIISDYEFQKILKMYTEISVSHQKILRKIQDLELLASAVSFEVEDLLYELNKQLDNSDAIIQKKFKQILKKEVQRLKSGDSEFNKEDFVKLQKEQNEIYLKVEQNLENCDVDIFENISDMVHNYGLKIISPNSNKETQQIISQHLLKFLNNNTNKNMVVLVGELDNLDIETQKCFKIFLQNQMVDIPNEAKEKPQVFYIPQFDKSMQEQRDKLLDTINNDDFEVKCPVEIQNYIKKHKSVKCCIQIYDNQANLLKQIYASNIKNQNMVYLENQQKLIFGGLKKQNLLIDDDKLSYQFFLPSGRIQYIGTFKFEQFEGNGKLFEDSQEQKLLWDGKFKKNEMFPQISIDLPYFENVQVNADNVEDWKQHKRIETIQMMQDYKNDQNECQDKCMDDFQGLTYVQFNQFFIFKSKEKLCDFCQLQYHKCNKEIAEVVYEVQNIKYNNQY